MKPYKIREPIWKNRSVGIALDRIPKEGMPLEITYMNKDGSRLFPDTYFVTQAYIKRFPIQHVKGAPPLHIVPISDLPLTGSFQALWSDEGEL